MMNPFQIKCIITDDEPYARKGLQGYIEKINFLKLVMVCEDALQLNNFLKEQKVDLLFLDIEMPHLSGIDFLKTISDPPKVIFATAFENYALQGFELDVIDYLLKPISFERFLKAANKTHEYFLSKNTHQQNYFFIKTENKLEKVSFDEIIFIEAMENYVAVYTIGKKMITHNTLKSVQQYLPPSQFIQTHKSYLVNMQRVTAVEGNMLHAAEFQVPISKYLKEEVLEKLLNNRVLKK